MHQLEKRVERLEATSGRHFPEHVIKIVVIPGGPVDTTGWKDVLRSEVDNGKGGHIFQHYDLVPPDQEETKERQ